MKTLKLYAAVLALSVTILSTGCKKNSNNNGFNWTGTAPFSVKINGVQYQATGGAAIRLQSNTTIIGYNASDTEFVVSIPNMVANNTIYSVPSPCNIELGITAPYNNIYLSTSGGVKILSYSTSSVSGLFYGTLKKTDTASSVPDVTYTLTDGYFNVNIK